MRKVTKYSLALAVVILLIFVLYYAFGRGNPNALWNIVDQQCVPNQKENGRPEPCKKVDLDSKYVTFKDAKGPIHDLLMPTYRLAGIESPELQNNDAPSFFAYAWNERIYLKKELGKKIADSYLSLAVNSKYGRSQDLLHVHIACLDSSVYRTLEIEQGNITLNWKPLSEKIKGHTYLARRLSANDLVREDPFKILGDYARSNDDDIAKFGLALVTLKDGGMALLANRMNLLGLNLGSAGEIQDFSCAIAGRQPAVQ